MGAKDQGTDAKTTAGRWHVIPRTLSFVTHGDDILLMKRGLHKRIFPGFYNGLGGHIERDEDPRSSATREIKEESGLDVINVRYCGTTHIDAGNQTGIMLFVFTAEAQSRHTIANDEGTLEWLHLPTLLQALANNSFTEPIVEDLPILLPRLFGGETEPFFAHVSYDDDDQIQWIESD